MVENKSSVFNAEMESMYEEFVEKQKIAIGLFKFVGDGVNYAGTCLVSE
jgi:hypothetical protein